MGCSLSRLLPPAHVTPGPGVRCLETALCPSTYGNHPNPPVLTCVPCRTCSFQRTRSKGSCPRFPLPPSAAHPRWQSPLRLRVARRAPSSWEWRHKLCPPAPWVFCTSCFVLLHCVLKRGVQPASVGVYTKNFCVCVLGDMDHELCGSHGRHLSHFCRMHVPSRAAGAECEEGGRGLLGAGPGGAGCDWKEEGPRLSLGTFWTNGPASFCGILGSGQVFFRTQQNPDTPAEQEGQVTQDFCRAHMRKLSPKDGKGLAQGSPTLVSLWVPAEDSARVPLSALASRALAGSKRMKRHESAQQREWDRRCERRCTEGAIASGRHRGPA